MSFVQYLWVEAVCNTMAKSGKVRFKIGICHKHTKKNNNSLVVTVWRFTGIWETRCCKKILIIFSRQQQNLFMLKV